MITAFQNAARWLAELSEGWANLRFGFGLP